MRRKSISKNKANDAPPLPFKSEQDEAAWLDSPAGKRQATRQLEAAIKAKRTQAVSLRIPTADIEAAQKLAAQMGIGYQTVLKEIISKGLRRAP
jgi:predicted DNA binding CopG/RHH family protein